MGINTRCKWNKDKGWIHLSSGLPYGGHRWARAPYERRPVTLEIAMSDDLNTRCTAALTGGNRCTLTGGDGSTLTGGNWSTLTGGDGSTLTGGDRCTLTGGHQSTLTGGYYSALSWRLWDGHRYRIHTVYPGEGGIKVGTAYRAIWRDGAAVVEEVERG